jgi:hypothetical protein
MGGDLDLGHGFHQTKQGLRYTISAAARRTVLDRLLALNHQRYAEEVAEGLYDKGAKKGEGRQGAAEEGVGGAEGAVLRCQDVRSRMLLWRSEARKECSGGKNGNSLEHVQRDQIIIA